MLTAPALFLGSRLIDFPSSSPKQKRKILPAHLSPEEQKTVQSSVMGRDLLDLFSQGYSCAESILTMYLRQTKWSEDLVWAAAGFGGGMYHRDLCGFLTGGLMAIGFSAGLLQVEREAAKEVCEKNVLSYWSWWIAQAPLHCSEIRTETTSPEVCRRIGQLAAAKVEELALSARL